MSYKLSQRYAKSILGLAIEQGKLDAIHKDVLLLDETISGHRDLALMLKSPVIHADKKINVMSLIFKNKIEDITWQFIELVVKKGREGQLLNFGKSFIEQYNVLKSISKVSITTASELSEVVIQSIKESLEYQKPTLIFNLETYLGKYDNTENIHFLTGNLLDDCNTLLRVLNLPELDQPKI